jgi:nitroreductase
MTFIELVKARQSVRNYKPNLQSKELLEQVLEAARLAPSAVNKQPWKFIVVTESALLKQLYSFYNRDWIETAPACIVVCGDHAESWHRAKDDKDHTNIDTAITIDHLTLQAAELGLGTCWVCNFDAEKCSELFELPSNIEPIALIPIGYPVNEEDLQPNEKKRKSLNEIVEWR